MDSMRRIGIVGLCVVAASAVGAAVAVSAWAGGPGASRPGFYECVKAQKEGEPAKYAGEYAARCLERAAVPKTGEYELEAVEFGTFEGKSGAIVLTTHTTTGVPVSVTCPKGRYMGELPGGDNYTFEVTFTFERCAAGKEKCGNSEVGKIETSRLEGQLMWLNSAETEPGILLAPLSYIAPAVPSFAKFKCGVGREVEVAGDVIGATKIGGKSTTFTFATNSQGEQAFNTFYYDAAAYGPFDLYTRAPSGAKQETTLKGEDTQKATGGVYVEIPAEGPVKPVNTEAPTVTGTLAVGQTLSCSAGTWSGSPAPTFAYQWLREGGAIAGATSATYTVASADQGHELVCEVTARNTAGRARADSAAVAIPAPTSEPTGGGSSGSGSAGNTAASTTSSSPGSSGVASFSSAKPPVIGLAGAIISKGDAVFVPLRCPTGTGACAAATFDLTVVEELSDGRLTAVTAKHKAKVTKRTVVIGELNLTMSAGETKTFEVSLNRAGKALLASHARLVARAQILSEGRTIATQSVSLARPAKKR